MSPEPVKVDVLGLGLVVRGTPADGYRARGVFRGKRVELAFSTLIDISHAELDDLLAQIERQYGDFSRKVHWYTSDGMVDLRWRLDDRGHLTGRMKLDDLGSWTFETEIEADQSYLPKMALGLRLLLRE
mgnify:CR=1 FL=1